MLVDTGVRTEAWGVLIAPVARGWRARLLTYPNLLWSVPGGRSSVKFWATTPAEAEQQAITWARDVCRARAYRFLGHAAPVEAAPGPEPEAGPELDAGAFPDRRFLRFYPIRFGVRTATERGLTANVSRDGLFLIADRPHPPGTRLKMMLELGPYSVPLAGEVVWARRTAEEARPAGMGVRLDAPASVYLRRLDELESEAPG